MNETVRIYGKVVNEWHSFDEQGRKVLTQQEIAYREYDADGEPKATGTEDFSIARRRYIRSASVHTWDGQKRNKGGYRWFDYHGNVKYRGNGQALRKVLEKEYPTAQLIQLRAI